MAVFIRILFYILAFYYLLILLEQITLFFVSKIIRQTSKEKSNILHKYLILIPAFREGKILFYTIDSIKKINYPKEIIKVVLLDDECDDKAIEEIKNDIDIVKLNLTFHSKVESLKQAIPFARSFEYVVVLDADNLLHPDFLLELNQYITPNTKVIQGLRIPKKIETICEKLDSLTDFIYNQLDRLIPSKLNLSSTLSGSGFAIESNLFAEMISEINTAGGFDKILQSKLALRKIPIEVSPKAVVFDEKISNSKSFISQRRRWLYYHFVNSKKFGFRLVLNGIIQKDLNQFHLGIISLRPPLTFLYLISLIIIFAGTFINLYLSIVLSALVILYSIIIFEILKREKLLSFKLIASLPLILINHIKSLLRINEAKFNSLRTEHQSEKSIEEILNDRKMTS